MLAKLVNHSILFDILLKCGLPPTIVRLLISWYSMQKMQVHCVSEPFSVSNGVRQVVISPHLFAVYLDGLLLELCNFGVGCYWGCSFAGGFSYADDVVLLAPSASALRIMLKICCTFSVSHQLELCETDANKTQLICFSMLHQFTQLPQQSISTELNFPTLTKWYI